VSNRPTIVITMGDATGIGPEIILKALQDKELYRKSKPLVIGDVKILEHINRILDIKVKIRSIKNPEDGIFQHGVIDCLNLNLLPKSLPFGKLSGEAGNAAYQYLKKAVELANKCKIDAICTAPLNKNALHKGGHKYPGHTEILAKLTGTKDFAMMLSAPNLNVVHVTTHVGLIDAINMITPKQVYTTINLADKALKNSEVKNPKIAVCGINPHAGENGLFGYGEEEEKIIPAIKKAQSEGVNVDGPYPADTLFYRTIKGDFDIIVAMYHDQGHSPIKVLGLNKGVNITIGLPIIRTSVDHGTAFEIAGEGKADESSMNRALWEAIKLTPKL